MGPNPETIVRVLQILATEIDAYVDLTISPSDESTGDTGGGINKSAEASRGMCHHNGSVDSVLKPISYEESSEGHSARGFHHS